MAIFAFLRSWRAAGFLDRLDARFPTCWRPKELVLAGSEPTTVGRLHQAPSEACATTLCHVPIALLAAFGGPHRCLPAKPWPSAG